MEKCLTFSPKRRIDVDEALKHPYLQVNISLTLPNSKTHTVVSPITIQPTSQRPNHWIHRSSTLTTGHPWAKKN